MKALLINSVCGTGSTGRICVDIAEQLLAQNNEVKIAYGRGEVPEKYQNLAVRIGTELGVKLDVIKNRIFDKHGFASKKATERFLKWADEFNPDLLWLHNIHGYYINVEMLFEWIKKRPNMQVKWTLHDCWAFTGHCSYFTFINCDKWKNGCESCPQKKAYPASYIYDNSRNNFERKKKAFTGVRNMTVITPSKWLADLVGKSFLKEYPIEVHHNNIDTEIFKNRPSKFKEKYGIENKKIILGVASEWDKRKGLDDFIKLYNMLDDEYKIVLVGLSDKQLSKIPNGIIGISRTKNATRLAEIYSAADVFFNPTYEDNYPTVNLEAEACGTRVITYKTGGAPETLKNSSSVVITCGDVAEAYNEIIKAGDKI